VLGGSYLAAEAAWEARASIEPGKKLLNGVPFAPRHLPTADMADRLLFLRSILGGRPATISACGFAAAAGGILLGRR